MFRFLLLVILLAGAALPARPAAAAQGGGGLRLSVSPGRDLYQPGDTAVFSVEAAGAGGLPGPFLLHFRFSEDKARLLEENELETSGGLILKQSLDRPGFLRLDLRLTAGADTLRQACACGFAPEAIRPTNALPWDFERFWGQGRAELMRVAMDPRLEPVAQEDDAAARRFLVSLANVEGSRIYGWLTVPAGPGPFPALVYIMGAPGG
ncbi:MAG: acetylxylan esterase, partial [Candidatus Glassbacteria bacterium]|nr:acetylxylan esterase [Candidatus Glassbacteria bacterium]